MNHNEVKYHIVYDRRFSLSFRIILHIIYQLIINQQKKKKKNFHNNFLFQLAFIVYESEVLILN